MFIAYVGAPCTCACWSLGFLQLFVGINTGLGGNSSLGTVGSTLLFPPFTFVDVTWKFEIGVTFLETGGCSGGWVLKYPERRGFFSLGGCNTVILLLLTL